MKDTKMDRRVRYTKTMLKNALVHLMQGQHISAISVKSLCEAADINRSTFYKHYSDQYDLLRSVEEDVMDNLRLYLATQDYRNNALPLSAQVLTSILEYAKQNADLFMALLSENCDFAFQNDVMALSQIISDQYHNSLSGRTKEYLELYGTTGCISIFHKWLKDGMDEPAEIIADLLLKVLFQGIAGFR